MLCLPALQQVQRHQRKLDQSAVQAVPLVWVGVAQEVTLRASVHCIFDCAHCCVAQTGSQVEAALLAQQDCRTALSRIHILPERHCNFGHSLPQHVLQPHDRSLTLWNLSAQVRLMGSFDNWSRGVALSSAGDAGDSVFHRFEGTLHVRKVRVGDALNDRASRFRKLSAAPCCTFDHASFVRLQSCDI